ncbi:hypothetical protein [Metamycoplasma canadense]|uniref:Uncharacterized protein n=1 Tax=Metamycoplasma canadense TaxID=29554 RepID=A0A077L7A4_9BACT|nr:hypothetical protein [Metamycoplasma canadense]BAP39686.1 hypothetical protein MCAN360_0598 [Metamycoplasma canadense]
MKKVKKFILSLTCLATVATTTMFIAVSIKKNEPSSDLKETNELLETYKSNKIELEKLKASLEEQNKNLIDILEKDKATEQELRLLEEKIENLTAKLQYEEWYSAKIKELSTKKEIVSEIEKINKNKKANTKTEFESLKNEIEAKISELSKKNS